MSPPRDEQDYQSKRQQIIDGALNVFAHKGFEQATNRDIADASGIGSPGLIYHYFRDKADLLREVVEERAPALQVIIHGDELMDRPPREVLMTFGRAFLVTFQNRAAMSMFRLMLGESMRRPAMAELFNKVGPGRGFVFLRAYLARQMELGTIRRMDPGIATRCFVGPLLAFVFTSQVLVQPDAASLSPEAMLDNAIEVFLRGMAVDEEPGK